MPSSLRHMRSLLNYLTLQNPEVDRYPCKDTRNTSAGRATWVYPRVLKFWEDFELQSLKFMYAGDLNTILEGLRNLHDYSYIPNLPFCQIHDEGALEGLLGKWTQSVVSEALATAQEDVVDRAPIYMVKGGQANYPDSDSSLRPDWAGVQMTRSKISRGELTNLLPGETKPSVKWSSRSIPEKNIQKLDRVNWTQEWVKPLAQIYTYCVRAEARYGYIVTDEELFAIRISYDSTPDPEGVAAIDSQGSNDSLEGQGILEFRSIPWTAYAKTRSDESKQLTMNLALFWLHILALEDNKIQDEYPPLREITQKAQPPKHNYSSFHSETSEIRHSLGETQIKAEKSPHKNGGKKRSGGDENIAPSGKRKRKVMFSSS